MEMTKEDEDEANDIVIDNNNGKRDETVMSADAEAAAEASAEAEEASEGCPPTTENNVISPQQPTKQDVGVQVNSSDETTNGDLCHNVNSLNNNYNNWQSVLLIKFRRRLAEQEAANRRLLKEKDEQLSKITTNLYLLESKLRRDQETIKRVLEEKDEKLAELDNQLRKLLRLNRRLAASRRQSSSAIPVSPIDHGSGIIKRKDSNRQGKKQMRRITWHNEVHVIHEYQTLSKSENEDDVIVTKDNNDSFQQRFQVYEDKVLEEEANEREEDDNNCFELSREINEACEAVDQALEEEEEEAAALENENSSCNDDNRLYHRSFSDLSLPIHSILQRSNENPGYCSSSSNCSCSPSLTSSDGDSGNSGSTASSPVTEMDFNAPVQNNNNGLGIYYNRIMNNHRTVTKPKDVKFKKISRVKSRSLEELRGRLRRPGSVYNGNSLIRDSHILLEQEEIV